MWLILTRLMGEQWRAQQELARAVGIEGPTLTRHLDTLEQAGLVVRRRDPDDRRTVKVELTQKGRERHAQLHVGEQHTDDQEDELAQLRQLLSKLEANVRSA